MNEYADLINRQQEELYAFPMKFAFDKKQFAEGMAELGLSPDDTDKIYRNDYGGFYRKEDAPRLREMGKRHDAEIQEKIENDATGDGFVYDMFLYELRNHEYGYTRELDDTLECLGYTLDEVCNDPALLHGLQKAMKHITGEEYETIN